MAEEQNGNEGKNVKVHYKGELKDGTVFDSSEEREPLEFKVGEGQVIQGFENAVRDMEVGETKKVEISSDEAYGERNDQNIVTVSRDELPEGIDPQEGMMLQVKTPQGPVPVRVTEVTDEELTLDANHPLAGKDLIFDITLVESD